MQLTFNRKNMTTQTELQIAPTQLMVMKNYDAAVVELMPGADKMRDDLLEATSMVVAVENDMAAQIAVDYLGDINRMLKEVEACRKALKAPVNTLAGQIEELARTFSEKLNAEVQRLKGMLNAHEEVKREAARKLEKEQLDRQFAEEQERRRIEAEQQKLREDAHRKLEKAKTEKQELKVLAESQEQQQALERQRADLLKKQEETAQAAIVRQPVKAAGSIVKTVWKYEVTDAAALYAAKPELVKLEPSAKSINAAITLGLRNCPGIRIWSQADVGARS